MAYSANSDKMKAADMGGQRSDPKRGGGSGSNLPDEKFDGTKHVVESIKGGVGVSGGSNANVVGSKTTPVKC